MIRNRFLYRTLKLATPTYGDLNHLVSLTMSGRSFVTHFLVFTNFFSKFSDWLESILVRKTINDSIFLQFLCISFYFKIFTECLWVKKLFLGKINSTFISSITVSISIYLGVINNSNFRVKLNKTKFKGNNSKRIVSKSARNKILFRLNFRFEKKIS